MLILKKCLRGTLFGVFWILFLAIVAMIAYSIIVYPNHWFIYFILIIGAVVGIIIMLNVKTIVKPATLLWLVALLVISLWIVPPYYGVNYVILDNGEEMRVFHTVLIKPFSSIKVRCTEDLSIGDSGVLTVEGNRKIRWRYTKKIIYKSSLEEAFNLVSKFVDVDLWQKEARKTFKEAVIEVLEEKVPQQLTQNSVIKISPGELELANLDKLGYQLTGPILIDFYPFVDQGISSSEET